MSILASSFRLAFRACARMMEAYSQMLDAVGVSSMSSIRYWVQPSPSRPPSLLRTVTASVGLPSANSA